jgi:hypothetical protein
MPSRTSNSAFSAVPLPTTAILSHLCDDPVYKDEIPYEIWADNVRSDVERTNVKLDLVPDCPLTNARSLSDHDKPTLETCGFQWFHQDFPYHTGLQSADDVRTDTQEHRDALDRYLTTMSDFLREKIGCEKVVCWDWRARFASFLFPCPLQLPAGLHSQRCADPSRAYLICIGPTLQNDASPNSAQHLQAGESRCGQPPCHQDQQFTCHSRRSVFVLVPFPLPYQ